MEAHQDLMGDMKQRKHRIGDPVKYDIDRLHNPPRTKVTNITVTSRGIYRINAAKPTFGFIHNNIGYPEERVFANNSNFLSCKPHDGCTVTFDFDFCNKKHKPTAQNNQIVERNASTNSDDSIMCKRTHSSESTTPAPPTRRRTSHPQGMSPAVPQPFHHSAIQDKPSRRRRR